MGNDGDNRMSWITDIFKGGTEGLVNSIAEAADRFITTDAEKMANKLETQKLVLNRMTEIEHTISTELEAKQKIITAELAQGDVYTKRARPTVVYFGLVVIAFNYCLIPLIMTFVRNSPAPFELPTEFWIAWGGIVSTWVVGRSAEKRGMGTKLTSFITGNGSPQLLN